MECRGASFVAILLIASSLIDLINSVCIVDRYPYPSKFWYNCVRSSDYVSDVNRAPIDIPHVSFAMSNIPIIYNGVLSRFAQNLTTLEVVESMLEEIEDDAFQGLIELSEVSLAGNELEIVKEVWFKNLPNLETIVLSHNKIQQIEDGFFPTVSPLKRLFIDYNELTCISKSALSRFYVENIQFELNPWSWHCLHVIINWLDEESTIEYDRYHYDNWSPIKNVTKNCIAQSLEPKPTDEFMNRCVQSKLGQWLPTSENNTARQICQNQDDPSPFLTCEFLS